jgi:hypothetical protein
MRKHTAGNRLIAQLAGAVDLARHRMRLKDGFYGPFNGQRKRIAIVEAIAASGDFGCAVETGTFRGTTTKFLADRFPRVVSIEINPRYVAFSRLRLRTRRNVEIVEGDSAAELAPILQRLESGRPIFAYLDAHWGNLPLTPELRALEESSLDYVAAIDDFEVPGDAGYGFDVHGGNHGAIGPALVFGAVPRLRRVWAPAAPSDVETGSMRGTGFLASPKLEPLLEALEGRKLLRPVLRSP